ncbi:hypothetical protein GCM10010260_38690 [Streptomyces filipinensis]|uniref:Uncharacterized protein n=1 Tax=Streptomyces filipinensis TaxID=66887 RepID=A0A918IDX2_9ACTN|nr:hypothetical protein GCM10010260_38690 [Streptomyces filipinensis]
MMQPGFEFRDTSPGDCGSLKTKPSLAMFRNMKVYMIGTSDGRSTAPGAKEIWTFARAREVPAGRFERAGVLDSDIAELPRCLSGGTIGFGRHPGHVDRKAWTECAHELRPSGV